MTSRFSSPIWIGRDVFHSLSSRRVWRVICRPSRSSPFFSSTSFSGSAARKAMSSPSDSGRFELRVRFSSERVAVVLVDDAVEDPVRP